MPNKTGGRMRQSHLLKNMNIVEPKPLSVKVATVSIVIIILYNILRKAHTIAASSLATLGLIGFVN